MKITAEVKFTPEEIGKTLYTEKEFDDRAFDELTIRFAQELRKMQPMLSKEEKIVDGAYFEYTHYKVQAIVISNETLFSLMDRLRDNLDPQQFEIVRNILINQI